MRWKPLRDDDDPLTVVPLDRFSSIKALWCKMWGHAALVEVSDYDLGFVPVCSRCERIQPSRDAYQPK